MRCRCMRTARPNEEKKIVAHHELGHAVVAIALPGADLVQKISIIPSGTAALGYTMQVPTEDRYALTKVSSLRFCGRMIGHPATHCYKL